MKRYKLLYFIIGIWILFFATSCRTVNRNWVKENFAEKATVNESLTVRDSIFKSEIKDVQKSLLSQLNQKVSEQSTKQKTTENETTKVSGSITPEEGKQKSVTIGNTKIESNGATVNFETVSSKALTKEIETKYRELEEKFTEQNSQIESLKSENKSIRTEFADFRSTYESEKRAKEKDSKNTGFSFGGWIALILVIIALGAIWYFSRFFKI